ncbi:MAG: hypothetical protein ACPGSD_14235 [Flavobacteriales bacterium]
MKSISSIYSVFILGISLNCYSQVGIGTSNPNPSSILDVSSTSKGMLIPRIDNPTSISNPSKGLMIYNKTLKCIQVNNGTPSSPLWECLGGVTNPIAPGPISQADCEQTFNNNYTFTSQAEWTDGARVVEIVNINGTTTYDDDLLAPPTDNWTPQGGIYSIADRDKPCYSTKVNDHSAITWTNSNSASGSGGMVIDAQAPKEVNFISVFNTPSDGTVTHIEMKYHPSESNTPPTYSDPGWITVFTKTPVEYYELDSTYTTSFQGSSYNVNRFTSGMTYSLPETIKARYWRAEAWNDNSLAPAPLDYIEVRQIKLMKFQ